MTLLDARARPVGEAFRGDPNRNKLSGFAAEDLDLFY